MGWNKGILDAVLVPFGTCALLGYHAWLYYQVRFHPMRTVVGVNHVNRRVWVKSIMKDMDKKNILAVQTLRNSIMASTLLASTSILLASGIAAFISSTSSATLRKSLSDIILGSDHEATVTVKFFGLLVCFLFAFFCHIQAIRYVNHVNFLINVPMGPDAPGLTPDYVADILKKGSDFYTIGTRGYYIAFPLLMWLFGPIPMFVCSIVLIPVLHYLDKTSSSQKTLEKDEDDVEEGELGHCQVGLQRKGSRQLNQQSDVIRGLNVRNICVDD